MEPIQFKYSTKSMIKLRDGASFGIITKCLLYPMVSSYPSVSPHGQAGENQKADGDNLVNL